MQGPKNNSSTSITQVPLYYVKVSSNDEKSHDISKTVVLSLERNLVELALGSNGKAELYFHAYFWYSFMQGVFARTVETPESAAELFDQ
jgi:hypothetical protein